MSGILHPPVFPSPERTEQARMLHTIAWATMVAATVILAIVMATQPSAQVRVAWVVLLVNAVGVVSLATSRWGRTRLASWVLVGGLILLIAVLALTAGGIRAPGLNTFLILVMMAGLLLGARSGVVAGAVCALIGLGLVLVEAAGWLPPPSVRYTSVTVWLLYCLFIAIVITLQRLAARAVRGALARAEAELEERRQTERERERLVHDLGERVKELRLLHAAARLLQTDRPFDRALLAELVALMPPAWQYPECCEARLAYGGLEVTTPGWRRTAWMQSAAFATSTGKGMIEVAYLEERPPAAEGPFLAEERALLGSLVEMLVTHLERVSADDSRRTVEAQLRQSQKLQALGTLAGGIAHDFNNILTAILGNAELGERDVPPDHRARVCFDQITKAGARATDLVKRILVFSRAQESARKAIALVPVVEEAITLLRSSLPSRVEIRATYAPDLPAVLADATQIHQIIMNLGTNAGHAMSEAGGVLAVELNRMMIGAAVNAPSADLRPGPHVQLTVRDTGTGMSPEILERVFEPFFTTKGAGGTGLGLAVVHGIVRDHEGAITVQSELGRGTTFQVYFPAAAQAAGQAAAEEAAVPGHGERIMYVDDEEAIVFLMTRSLERLGYEMVGYSNPHEALQAFRTSPHSFDAVVTDMTMPGMTGVELARALRGIRPDVRVALASGYREDAQAVAAGIQTIIQKPATLEDLGGALHGMLQR